MATAAAKAYLLELAKNSDMDPAIQEAILKAAENEKFATGMVGDHKRQSEFSRSMDELRTKASEMDARSREWTDWYNRAVENDRTREAELEEWRTGKRTAANPNPTPAGPATLTKKDLDEQTNLMIAVVKQTAKIASRHAAQFHEELDVDAVEKIAREQGLNVQAAYEKFIEPRVQAAKDADVEARIKKAREEGVQEGLSKQTAPTEASRGHHVFFDRKVEATPATERARVDSFAEAWRKGAETGVNR